MKITPASAALGAVVTDLDLRQPLAAAQREELLAAWRRHHLLVFPDQALDDEQHVRICELFGPVQVEADGQRFNYVTNHGATGLVAEERFEWHMDYCFTPYPVTAISLYAQELPEGGTATYFANNVRGFETLPAPLKQRALALQIRNLGDLASGDQMAVLYRKPRPSADHPHVITPLVRTHPATGERHLYCCHMMTDHIEGLPDAESNALLADIFAHLYAPENVYEHRWALGQLVIWDNTALQHARPDASLARGARTLRRVCVAEHDVVKFLAPYWARTQWRETLSDV